MAAEQLATLVRKRSILKARVSATLNYFMESKAKVVDLDAHSKSTLLIQLHLRLDNLDTVRQQFEAIQDQLDEITEDVGEQLDEREQFQSSLYDTVSEIKQFLSEYEGKPRELDDDRHSSSTHSSNNSFTTERVKNIKLPQIKLPVFSGSYDNWLEFRDTFHSLIHTNEHIGEIQKFHYLRATLQGTAAQVIYSIEFSASNYKMAWELLCERYNNKSLLIHTHVKSLFNLPNLTRESSVELRNFIDQISKTLRSLQILGQPTDQWDTLIIYIITGKLDKTTARKWEELKTDGIPTLENMKEFLKHRADVFETLEFNKSPARGEVSTKINPRTRAFTATSDHKCIICDGAHYIFNCETFLKQPIDKRFERIKALRVCFNCLKPGHMSKECTSGVCKKCGATHHTLLHFERTSDTQAQGTSKNEVALTSKTTVSCSSQVLLSTALVQIIDSNGYAHTCRALLDSGAQSNFITAKLCEKLQLPTKKTQVSVSGINQVTAAVNQRCEVTLQSLHGSFEATVSCLVMKTLGDELPNNQFNVKSHPIPPYIRLADPSFHKPSPIDLIIGAGLFWRLLCVGQHRLESTTLTLQKTRLGWIMTGEQSTERFATHVKCNFERDCNSQLQSQLEMFWAIEEYQPTQKILSSEEQHCEDTFAETTRRTDDGRFIIPLPLKESTSKVGDSKNIALKRFHSLERKLSMNPEFKAKYVEFMSEYKQLGHMSQSNNTQARDVKTLGLYWSNQDDVLLFKIKPQQVHTSVIKRTILSQIAQIFDPLGLLSPTIITARMILQNLRSCKLSWDSSVPPDNITKWKTFKEQLPLLNTLRIPRHMSCNKPFDIELRGFADASREAYGACIYLRSTNTQGNTHVNLVMSKTRIAPLGAITILRLELCAAIMLSQLVKEVTAALKLTFKGIYLWSDSNVTLHWINTSPHTLQVFVGNRVSQIQSLTQKEGWRHISSEDNPADLLTRGLTPQSLLHSQLWLHGSSWLKKPKSEWPKPLITWKETPPETRKLTRVCHTQETDPFFNIEGHSALTQAKRVMGYVKRFNINSRQPIGERQTGVKQVKANLKKMIGNANLTYEQLYTTLTQIKAILNSCPITPLSADPNDLNALTPGHFLIGRRITSAPDPDVTYVQDNRLSKFQFLQKIQQQFWARWNKEYISELQTRVKWNRNQGSLETGTLVVIKEDNTPPLRWTLGRVIQVFPGPDGIARVASVKTPDGIIKRAFSRLCPLPSN